MSVLMLVTIAAYTIAHQVDAFELINPEHCRVYCNGHSDICEVPTTNQNSSSEELEVLSGSSLHAPQNNWHCSNCQHFTSGKRCDRCLPGYFQVGDNIADGCRLCHCNGHGDFCNSMTGENCNCQNNTENDRQCNQKSRNPKEMLVPCWQLQCSKCKEYFMGDPTDGHQCYRHMFLDKDYCFDPDNQDKCLSAPNALLSGRTVFFAVQPRYMNVDIRIVVDITKGGVDFYLSAKEDTFVVDVNKTTGIHQITLDKRYANSLISEFDFDRFLANTNKEFFFNDSSLSNSSSSFLRSSQLSFVTPKLRHRFANGLFYYLTIDDPNEFLIIRNLTNRLVITIPKEVHDLRSTRFYMVLYGIDTGTSNHTFGNLFFRQDQRRIDLFVFFSVFFSCFFLFLAACVVVWKIKQGFDLRRARRLHAAEMKHMASRPFSVVVAQIDTSSDYDDFEFALSSPAHHLNANVKRAKVFRSKGNLSSIKESPKALKQEIAERYLIRPVAVESTADSVCAVVTTLITLPGGCSAPVKMSLASALVSIRGSHNILNYNHYNSSNNVTAIGTGVWRVAMRRRAF